MGCTDNLDQASTHIAAVLDKSSGSKEADMALQKCLREIYFADSSKFPYEPTVRDFISDIQTKEKPGVGMDLDLNSQSINQNLAGRPYIIRHAGEPKK